MALDFDMGLSILRRAISTEIGVKVTFEGERQTMANAFRTLIKQMKGQEPELENLCILQPKDGSLYICKKDVELP